MGIFTRIILVSIVVLIALHALAPNGSAQSSSEPQSDNLPAQEKTEKKNWICPDITTSVSIASITLLWVAASVNLFVIPFYSKCESLHKDYATNGKLASAEASIESKQIIPALARMFILATDQRSDKRKRLEQQELEGLLHAAEFAADLELAQTGMSEIESIKGHYNRLRSSSKRTWSTALIHVAFSLSLPVAYLFLIPNFPRLGFSFWILLGGWGISLCMSISYFVRFHGNMERFNQSLETTSVQER